MKYIKTLEKAREDQVCIVKGICDQERAKCRTVVERQKALKASLILPDESEDKIPMCLGDKKHAAQSIASAAPTTLTSGSATSGTFSKPKGSGASLSVTLADRIFADTQAHTMYNKFLNADDKI